MDKELTDRRFKDFQNLEHELSARAGRRLEVNFGKKEIGKLSKCLID